MWLNNMHIFKTITGTSLLILLIVIPGRCYLPARPWGGYPGEGFEKVSDAYISGRGGASCALSMNSFNINNPAGTGKIFGPNLLLSYGSLLGGASFSFLNFSSPFLYGNFSFSRANIGVDDIQKTTAFGKTITTIKDEQTRNFLSYSQNVTDELKVGGSVGILSHKIDIYEDTDFFLDSGLLYKPDFFSDLSGGISVENIISPSIKLKDTSENYPLNLRVGLAYKINEPRFVVSADGKIMDVLGKYSHYRSFKGSLGIGYTYEPLTLKVGLNHRELSAGFDLYLDFVNVNIGYSVNYNALGLIHNFTIKSGLALGLDSEERKVVEEYRRNKEIREILLRASRKKEEEKYKAASALLNNLLNIQPEHEEALKLKEESTNRLNRRKAKKIFDRGLTEELASHSDRAVELFRKATGLWENISSFKEKEYFEKAVRYIDEGELENGRKKIEKVIIINPDNRRAQEMYIRIRRLKEME